MDNLIGVSVTCRAVSFSPKGTPAWIIGINESLPNSYCVSRTRDATHGIWCKRHEFTINDDEFAKQALRNEIERLEAALKKTKEELGYYAS